MKHELNIFGEIADENVFFDESTITPSSFSESVNGLKEGDELELHFNSPGGSVTGGIAIANKIRDLNKRGIKTIAKVDGLCASIATVIMCACDKVVLSEESFCMIHNCWTMAQGNADELRKQADVMDKMDDAILSFYRSKFDLTDEELKAYMDAETWFSGIEANTTFKMKCEVVPSERMMKLAASLRKYNFKNLPKRILSMTENEEKVIVAEVEQPVADGDVISSPVEGEVVVETAEPSVEENVEENVEEQIDPETTQDVGALRELLFKAYERVEELEHEVSEIEDKMKTTPHDETRISDFVSKEECEKRVSGMQSKMQAQINDFHNQLMAKNEELISAKTEITSLKNSLEKTSEELKSVKANLEQTASALEEKNTALEKLNSRVNAQAEELPTYQEGLALCASPAEKVAFIKSGKWKK